MPLWSMVRQNSTKMPSVSRKMSLPSHQALWGEVFSGSWRQGAERIPKGRSWPETGSSEQGGVACFLCDLGRANSPSDVLWLLRPIAFLQQGAGWRRSPLSASAAPLAHITVFPLRAAVSSGPFSCLSFCPFLSKAARVIFQNCDSDFASPRGENLSMISFTRGRTLGCFKSVSKALNNLSPDFSIHPSIDPSIPPPILPRPDPGFHPSTQPGTHPSPTACSVWSVMNFVPFLKQAKLVPDSRYTI